MADPARTAALRVLEAVLIHGRSLSTVLDPALGLLQVPRDRAFAQEQVFGVLRWYPRLRVLLDHLLQQPLRSRDRDVDIVLLLGLYQIQHTRVPAYAAVNGAVELAKSRGKGWAKGLVNGVLRRFLRERATLEQSLENDPRWRYAHPPWLLKALGDAWPGAVDDIARANNHQAPMTLRVNLARGSREAYLEALEDRGLEAHPGRHSASAVVLVEPCPVEALPGFSGGRVAVQDEAAQLAAGLLAPGPGHRVLDACAAPGGKTAHLLEFAPDAAVVALDRSLERLSRVTDNLARLGLSGDVIAGDAGDPDGWWDGTPFQRILLDAPCSATGVIRRHPDVKVLRRADDIAPLAQGQLHLLEALWPLLAEGGSLLYATCSVLPQENSHVVRGFLARHPEARHVPIPAAWGRPVAVGRQILPGEDEMDGFYYALLHKAHP